MKSWKTTLCGVLVLVGTLVPQFFPEVARYGAFCAALGSGLGLLFARDNNVTSEAVGLKVEPLGHMFKKPVQGPLLLLFLLPALLLTGAESRV